MSSLIEPFAKPAVYRVLVLAPDGAVLDTKRLTAADDHKAIVLAKSLVECHAIELWDGLRFIKHCDALGPHT